MKESEKHIYGDDSLRFLWLDLSRIAQSYSLSMYDPEPDLAFLKKFESEFLAGLEYNIFWEKYSVVKSAFFVILI